MTAPTPTGLRLRTGGGRILGPGGVRAPGGPPGLQNRCGGESSQAGSIPVRLRKSVTCGNVQAEGTVYEPPLGELLAAGCTVRRPGGLIVDRRRRPPRRTGGTRWGSASRRRRVD